MASFSRAPFAVVLCLAVGLPACADSPPEPTFPKPKATATAAPTAQRPTAPPGQIARFDLDEVLRAGPSQLFEEVITEGVVTKGKFVGWRLLATPYHWGSKHIRPGDVVTGVNSMPVQTPSDLWAAWTKLSNAKELRVAFLRNGKPQTVTLPVWGESDPKLAAELQKQPQRAPDSPIGKRKRSRTIVISEGEGSY